MSGLQKPTFSKVSSLEPASHGHNLIVKVVDVKIVVDKVRRDGAHVRLAEALVGDESGTVTVTLRDAQIPLAQTGGALILRNARVVMFKGFMRLAIDRWGKVEAAPPEMVDFEVDAAPGKNLSQVEYELVVVDTNTG